MTLNAAIFSKLSASTALTALVGTNFHPSNGPERVQADHIIWEKVVTVTDPTLNEASGSRFRLIRFECYAKESARAELIRDTLVQALDSVTLDNGDIGQLDDESETYEPEVKLNRADAFINF